MGGFAIGALPDVRRRSGQVPIDCWAMARKLSCTLPSTSGLMMPRTVDEILQHADEHAARFENYEPDPADELDPGSATATRSGEAANQLPRLAQV